MAKQPRSLPIPNEIKTTEPRSVKLQRGKVWRIVWEIAFRRQIAAMNPSKIGSVINMAKSLVIRFAVRGPESTMVTECRLKIGEAKISRKWIIVVLGELDEPV